jgi:hypothetical protein
MSAAETLRSALVSIRERDVARRVSVSVKSRALDQRGHRMHNRARSPSVAGVSPKLDFSPILLFIRDNHVQGDDVRVSKKDYTSPTCP